MMIRLTTSIDAGLGQRKESMKRCMFGNLRD